MVAGFLLGPSVLGWIWPAAQQWLFPTKLTIGAETFTHPNLTAIYVVGQLGLVLYMFLVGASFKLDILGAHVQAGRCHLGRRHRRPAGPRRRRRMVDGRASAGTSRTRWRIGRAGCSSRPPWRSPRSRCWRGSSTTPDCSTPGWGRWRCPVPPSTTRARGCCWRRWWRRPREACSEPSWPSVAGWAICCSWSTSAVRCSRDWRHGHRPAPTPNAPAAYRSRTPASFSSSC